MSNIKSEIDKWYENYIDELFAYGIAFGVEKDFVLDAIHDLFLHLFESADKIEILGSPKSYLFSALKNKIITSLRKQANWLSLEEEVEYNFKIEVDAEALMEDEEERRNYEKEVESLLNLLTNKQRHIFALYQSTLHTRNFRNTQYHTQKCAKNDLPCHRTYATRKN